MDVRKSLRLGAAGGMARLLLVAAAVTGFLLMHGLAATDSAGVHHLGGYRFHDPTAMTAQAAEHSLAPMVGNRADHSPASHDAAMAGCVFILLALAGGIVLRALGTYDFPNSAPGRRRPARHDGPARAPPCPVFISLCVFRL